MGLWVAHSRMVVVCGDIGVMGQSVSGRGDGRGVRGAHGGGG